MTNTKHILAAWLPVAVWLALIALESTDMFSSAHTGGFLYGIVVALFAHVNANLLATMNALLRKTGHFLGYAILSFLFFRALRQTFASAAASVCANGRWAFIAVLFTMLVAAFDELHQTLIPSRTGCLRDVILDTFGALCMQVLVLAVLQVRSSRSAQQASETAD